MGTLKGETGLYDALEARAIKAYAQILESRLRLSKQVIAQNRSLFKDLALTLSQGWGVIPRDLVKEDERLADWVEKVDRYSSLCSKLADEDDALTAEEKGDG